MKRRLQIMMLLWGCILMQAASVFPHHHHADALCLHHDAENSRPTVPQGCSSGCITHFNLTIPARRLSLQNTVSREIYKDIAACLCKGLFLPETTGHARRTVYDGLLFYESRPSGGTGLRAPPCLYVI